ncbi:hypothetical protein AGR8A_Cc20025 [Agrobacterium fabrum str. J-07]|nr:hypothetical protein AGR8A_Cc20025 [Agrobacterium fabrum str. J-07]
MCGEVNSRAEVPMRSGTPPLVSSPPRVSLRQRNERVTVEKYGKLAPLPDHPGHLLPCREKKTRQRLRSRMRLAVPLFVTDRVVMIPGAEIHVRLLCLTLKLAQPAIAELGNARTPANRELKDRCRLAMKASCHIDHLTLFASKHLGLEQTRKDWIRSV